jgi:hypothetical protein
MLRSWGNHARDAKVIGVLQVNRRLTRREETLCQAHLVPMKTIPIERLFSD